jgi:hypothetical protein
MHLLSTIAILVKLKENTHAAIVTLCLEYNNFDNKFEILHVRTFAQAVQVFIPIIDFLKENQM